MTNFIFYVNPEVALACIPSGLVSLYSLETAAQLTGVHPEMLRHYCQLGLLGRHRSTADHDPIFDDHALSEIRRIEHYRQYEGINLQAMPLVCELRREVERLQSEIRFLRSS